MRHIPTFPTLLLCVLGLAAASVPGVQARTPTLAGSLDSDRASVRHGAALASSSEDTLVLMGSWSSGAAHNGQFENANGVRDWNGWTSRDLTRRDGSHWNVRPMPGQPGDLAAWSYDRNFPSCGPGDPVGGYGNEWFEMLEFRLAVPHPELASVVTVTADLSCDLEPGYDLVGLAAWRAGDFEPVIVRSWDDKVQVQVDELLTWLPGEYRTGGEVVLQFQVVTDELYSDEDCNYPSSYAAILDDITVTVVNGDSTLVRATDFQDGSFGAWPVAYPVAVGDFAGLWQQLDDLDPCAQNNSPQLAFIDDGVVVPGTGGSPCLNWCYGPRGYGVNTTGGLLGPDADLSNEVVGPVIAWPAGGWDGCTLAFDGYLHELSDGSTGPIYARWGIRSTSSADPAALEDAEWVDRGFAYVGDGRYGRYQDDISDLVVPNPSYVQLRFFVYEPFGVYYGEGVDTTPAPYFDNIRLAAHRKAGPDLAARAVDIAADGFPAVGDILAGDPGRLSVRFDMGSNISPVLDMRLDPGDSIVVSLRTSRPGSALVARPRLHYRLIPNPAFDPWRTSGLPLHGDVASLNLVPTQGSFIGKMAFDLPDTGFLFPGDVLHYFIAAIDQIDGVRGTTLLPADTTGFSMPPGTGPGAYDADFTMRALPTLVPDENDPTAFAAPPLLVWDDDGAFAGRARWHHALGQLGLVPGVDYDVYRTRGAPFGAGHGLGGRATAAQLDLYSAVVYSSGDLGNFTLSDGVFGLDPSDDIGVLETWLATGGKGLFLAGDNLANDLDGTGAVSEAFLSDIMGLVFDGPDLRGLVGNQASPVARAEPGNPVFPADRVWLAYGACDNLNRFDAVRPIGSAVALASFLPPGGGDPYPWAAATLNILPGGSRVISLPTALEFVTTAPGEVPAGGVTARTRLLADVLGHFGLPVGSAIASDVPATWRIAVANHPNPFNPRTTIRYTVPREGPVRLRIHDVRGRLVRTLLDESRPAGPDRIVWDGTDAQGRGVASGVYFMELRAAGEVETGRLVLVR